MFCCVLQSCKKLCSIRHSVASWFWHEKFFSSLYISWFFNCIFSKIWQYVWFLKKISLISSIVMPKKPQINFAVQKMVYIPLRVPLYIELTKNLHTKWEITEYTNRKTHLKHDLKWIPRKHFQKNRTIWAISTYKYFLFIRKKNLWTCNWTGIFFNWKKRDTILLPLQYPLRIVIKSLKSFAAQGSF